eukprot:PhF_6_TR35047/c0_g1_i2/m.51069
MFRKCLRRLYHQKKYVVSGKVDPFGEKTGWDEHLALAPWDHINVEAINAATETMKHEHFGADWCRGRHLFNKAAAQTCAKDLPDSPSSSSSSQNGSLETESASVVPMVTPEEAAGQPEHKE